jgi:hypothetical protein
MTHCISNDGTIWQGEPINGVQHPQNIVDLWTDEELSVIGLTKVVTVSVQPTEADLVRGERNYLLITVVDPIATNVLRWNDLTEAEQQALAKYRRNLLDVPNQDGFPQNVIWPVKP